MYNVLFAKNKQEISEQFDDLGDAIRFCREQYYSESRSEREKIEYCCIEDEEDNTIYDQLDRFDIKIDPSDWTFSVPELDKSFHKKHYIFDYTKDDQIYMHDLTEAVVESWKIGELGDAERSLIDMTSLINENDNIQDMYRLRKWHIGKDEKTGKYWRLKR